MPAVVFVHGSGPMDRDGTVGACRPFRDLAWQLAERRIATLRYEKRTRLYGREVADVFPLNLSTSSIRMRAVVIVAVKHDLALIAAAFGPYHQFGPTFGPGRPSPANVQIAEDMGRYVNSFRWKGDPPR